MHSCILVELLARSVSHWSDIIGNKECLNHCEGWKKVWRACVSSVVDRYVLECLLWPERFEKRKMYENFGLFRDWYSSLWNIKSTEETAMSVITAMSLLEGVKADDLLYNNFTQCQDLQNLPIKCEALCFDHSVCSHKWVLVRETHNNIYL